jgi:hypothetical protein
MVLTADKEHRSIDLVYPKLDYKKYFTLEISNTALCPIQPNTSSAFTIQLILDDVRKTTQVT